MAVLRISEDAPLVGTSHVSVTLKKVHVAFDNSYTGSGGEAITAAQFGLTTIKAIDDVSVAGYIIKGDVANLKLTVYETLTGATGATGPLVEVTAGVDLSVVLADVPLRVYGLL